MRSDTPCPVELLERAREGALSPAESRLLDAHVRECPLCALTHCLGDELLAAASVQPGDEAMVARIAERALLALSGPRPIEAQTTLTPAPTAHEGPSSGVLRRGGSSPALRARRKRLVPLLVAAVFSFVALSAAAATGALGRVRAWVTATVTRGAGSSAHTHAGSARGHVARAAALQNESPPATAPAPSSTDALASAVALASAAPTIDTPTLDGMLAPSAAPAPAPAIDRPRDEHALGEPVAPPEPALALDEPATGTRSHRRHRRHHDHAARRHRAQRPRDAGARGARADATTEARASAAPDASTTAAPTDARAVFRAAVEARRAGAFDEAERGFRQLVDQHAASPEAAVGRIALGRLLLEQRHDASGALAQFERYLAQAPDGALREEALYRSALSLARLGRTADELRAWRLLLETAPESVYAGRARARLATTP